ncbi:glycolipid 2-alpha-mannosyltransferase-domain-containing protein [Scheffersomyces amazonensis]|uniref:glycolipid 2-alpha-mannosyltransferase-domain-containing protein n=1 Tax=Scheffersomyces amazonensis TaxID=1078765 RepID=UPI00315C8AF5
MSLCLCSSVSRFRKKYTGFHIEPQNVRFKYINPKNKVGTFESIAEEHENRFKELLSQKINEPKDTDIEKLRPASDPDNYERANATIISLVRNSEIGDIEKTMSTFEEKFNKKFRYTYTFINDEEFSQEFKDKVKSFSLAPMNFVTIPNSLWRKPDSIDEETQKKAIEKMKADGVSYADMDSYHNMCRFYSGNFYNIPELQKYKYYWRIEPGVKFYSDINYDVFKYLENTGKIYGFVVNAYDIAASIPTLWTETMKFLNTGNNYKYVNENGAFQWLLNDLQHPDNNEVTNGYSTCHFWSNFEIADMDFYRSEAYSKWFKYLDSTGKFYYERWGDAPVHSIGLGLFADKSKIHWFRDIGYYHNPFFNCPNHPKTSESNLAAEKFSPPIFSSGQIISPRLRNVKSKISSS